MIPKAKVRLAKMRDLSLEKGEQVATSPSSSTSTLMAVISELAMMLLLCNLWLDCTMTVENGKNYFCLYCRYAVYICMQQLFFLGFSTPNVEERTKHNNIKYNHHPLV